VKTAETGSITRLAALLAAARRIVVFTGAGISTESGIPDFRGPGGLWTKVTAIDFSDYMRDEATRREAWRRKIEMDQRFRNATPNRGHRAVAELVRRGSCHAVITQNVDDLHQRSGIPAEKVIELHGNSTYAKCLRCGLRHELEPIFAAFERDGMLPACVACGGIVKSATISFGQPMPEREMQRAREAALQCDLFLAVGSSLVVYPAASFPALAKRHGARLAIINREATDQDDIADLVVHADIGPTLGQLVGVD